MAHQLLRRFKRDPLFFVKYYGAAFAALVVVDTLASLMWRTRTVTGFAVWQLGLIPVGVVAGIFSAVMMHNAAHGQLRPVWMNRIVGELCALHQLYGFAGWQIPHLFHHQHPDERGLDPHPPGDLTFWQFFSSMRRTLRQCLGDAYFRLWKGWPGAERAWTALKLLATCGMGLRLAFWALLLGPALFLTLFVPSYVANVLFFAHFNYFTHRPSVDGAPEILNLNHNLYYRTVNRWFFGVYFHKNHHEQPALFNPSRAVGKAQYRRPLLQGAYEVPHGEPAGASVARTPYGAE
jgi:fatty acid desaturase